MKQHRDSQKPIALVQHYSEGPVAPEEIQVVPTGTWDHPAYGEMAIDSKAIAQFVQNFKDKVRLKIPITAGHDTGMGGGEYGELPAIGWFTELIDRGVNGLWGAVDWTQQGKDLIAQGAFKYFSPEFYETYTDPETQTKYEHVLVGGALTNKPYFKELEPVAFAFSEPNIMNQYNKDNMSTDKKKFDEDAAAAEAAAKAAADKAAADKAAEEAAAAEKAAADKAAEEAAAAEAAKKATEGGEEKVSASELKLLRDAADKGAKAFAELEAMKADRFAEKLMFSDKNTEGRFLPKQSDAVKKFVRTLSETQRDQFATIVRESAAPKLSFKEVGDTGKTDAGIQAVASEVDTAVKAKMSEFKLSYSEAARKVLKENPDLAKRYNDEMAQAE